MATRGRIEFEHREKVWIYHDLGTTDIKLSGNEWKSRINCREKQWYKKVNGYNKVYACPE